ncbi:MAG: ferritin [Christensenella sp.]|uniref:ferritin n=1 Tax=Christensenella sp. TaxID=1935934 RepID=UPI002B2057D5|nr:ferritin [Christensenella sp.]MEA5004629.1 ferritin [Christensenella sp.]
MISKKMESMLNEQMKNEFFSAYFYLAMAAWFSSKNLNGFANWYRIQAQEERDHATMIMDYTLRVGANAEFLTIEAPDANFASPMDIFEKTLEHEQKVTAMINDLMGAAIDERDFKTQQFLQWYVSEQVEEEENATGLIEKLRIAGNSEAGILYMDAEAATRVYTPAVQATT